LRHNRGNPETEVNRSLNHRATSRLYIAVAKVNDKVWLVSADVAIERNLPASI
jgi:hypothetical protein